MPRVHLRKLCLCSSFSPRCRRQLVLTLLFLNLGGLRRTRDLRGYTGDALGLLAGRPRAYGYCHTERNLSQLARADGAEVLTTALGKWTTHLWSLGTGERDKEPACIYIDGHRKPVYADCLLPRGLVGRSGKILGSRALVLLHDEQGHPRLATTSRGDQHLTAGLPHVLARYEQAGGKTAHARIIVDREGMAALFLRDLAQAGHIVVTVLRTDQYAGLESFTGVGTFLPLTYDRKGQLIREVAQACFALPLPDQTGQFLPLRVALIRDLRRQVPCSPREAETEQDGRVPAWWHDGWQAEPTAAQPTTAKLIPIVTTAQSIDAVELAQTYMRRWPLQENVIRDYLLPLGLDTNHGYGRERSHRASLRYTRLWKETKPKGEERYRVLDKQLQALEVQGISQGQWKVERNRLQAEAESEMAELWQRVYRVLDTSNKEHAKWERYCREQGDLLRALENLAAQERTMYELDNRKDQIMTVCKLALTNLVMWVRDQYFPPTYAHATWGRLLPFFQLPGVVTSSPSAIWVELRPFNDRQYNRDLLLLCQRVNEKHLHLPDGRLLLFSVKEMVRPILHQQERLIA